MEGQASFQTVPALAAVSGRRPRPQVPSGCLTRRWATPGLTLGQEPRRIFSPAEAAASGPKERSDRLKTLNAPCAPLRLPTFSSTCRPAVRHSSHARLPLLCDTLGHCPWAAARGLITCPWPAGSPFIHSADVTVPRAGSAATGEARPGVLRLPVP